MTVQSVLELFQQYGLPMMAAVFFCEYLNLPGFPAGVIMPAVGVLIGQSELNLVLAIGVSIAAGLAGSLVIYAISYFGGAPLLTRIFGKSMKFHKIMPRVFGKRTGQGIICVPTDPGAAYDRVHPSRAGAYAAARICGVVGSGDCGVEFGADLLRVFFQRGIFEWRAVLLPIRCTFCPRKKRENRGQRARLKKN